MVRKLFTHYYRYSLLCILSVVWVWSLWEPNNGMNWLLENKVVFLCTPIVYALIVRYITFSKISLTLTTSYKNPHLRGFLYATILDSVYLKVPGCMTNLFSKLTTPQKIQDYLDSIPFNYEKDGETCMSPARVLGEKKAHCIEGAMLAAAALMHVGEKPLILSLKVRNDDFDHVVALFKRNGYWGAISKTNHAVLRYRDPVYATIRELAMSYFHEYFLTTNGEKTLRGYSRPINLNRFGKDWVHASHDLWDIAETIFDANHIAIVPPSNKRYLRNASRVERQAASIKDWDI